MSYSPWQHIDKLKAEQETLRRELDALGWRLLNPTDGFNVARRCSSLGYKGEMRVRALRPADLLAKVKDLERANAERLEAKRPKGQG
jgi:hypothetical protein